MRSYVLSKVVYGSNFLITITAYNRVMLPFKQRVSIYRIYIKKFIQVFYKI